MSLDTQIHRAQMTTNEKLGVLIAIEQQLLSHIEQHRAAQELALEEQKTANLIAYLQLSRTTGITPLTPVEEQRLDAQIRDRLGI